MRSAIPRTNRTKYQYVCGIYLRSLRSWKMTKVVNFRIGFSPVACHKHKRSLWKSHSDIPSMLLSLAAGGSHQQQPAADGSTKNQASVPFTGSFWDVCDQSVCRLRRDRLGFSFVSCA